MAMVKFLGMIYLTSFAHGQGLVEEYGKLTLDWGQLKIRFQGSSRDQGSVSDWTIQEETAVHRALKEMQADVASLHKSRCGHYCGDPIQRGEELSRQSYVYNSIFYKDGHVTVSMESSLIPVFALGKPSLPSKALSKSPFSGLVLRLDQRTTPVPFYELQDESGQTLFHREQLSTPFREQQIMGRWFKEPISRQDWQKWVGKTPLFVWAKVEKTGVYRLSSRTWQDVMKVEDYLATGRVLLVVPGEHRPQGQE